MTEEEQENIRESPMVPWSIEPDRPRIDSSAYIDPEAVVIGSVSIGRLVFIGPAASIRGDEGKPIFIGDDSNVQDGAVIHGHRIDLDKNQVEVAGRKYSVYISEQVSISHLAVIHGPAIINENTFIGMGSVVWRAMVGKHCVVMPRVVIMDVIIPDGRYIPPGTVITNQTVANLLDPVDKTEFKGFNREVVDANKELARGYNMQDVYDI